MAHGGFPPIPVFPLALDSDTTLYLVYNTAEAQTTSDNTAWADEIEIEQVVGDEQWGDNGFANISGEMFYYDAVETDAVTGKIIKLKRCARNLSGSHTKDNKAGTWVRGFVVAEHHTQLADTTILTENYIGENFSEDTETLDYKIRNLVALPGVMDDHQCADVIFDAQIDTSSSNDTEGTLLIYTVTISGSYSQYTLDFGDGTTTTEQSGTHRYAPNLTIEPIVIVSNAACEVIQTPQNLSTENEPSTEQTPIEFEIPIPELPAFPEIIIPEITIPEDRLMLPPIVFPCVDVGPISMGPIPSIIEIIPSVITIVASSDLHIPSIIEFIDPPIIPSIISIMPVIGLSNITLIDTLNLSNITLIGSVTGLSNITLISNIVTGLSNITLISNVVTGLSNITLINGLGLSDITLINGLGFSTISLVNALGFSTISVVGIPSAITCIVSVVCPASMAALGQNLTDDPANFVDVFSPTSSADPMIQGLGIPNEISVIVPKFPTIKVEHNIPFKIAIEAPEIPNLSILGGEKIPTKIAVVQEIPIPMVITVESKLPTIITIDGSTLPGFISLSVPDNFPTMISIDASGIPKTIQVIGVPESIELKGNIPSEIKVTIPDNLEIPLVYKGGPIPIKFDEKALLGENGEDLPCFAIVPCPRK